MLGFSILFPVCGADAVLPTTRAGLNYGFASGSLAWVSDERMAAFFGGLCWLFMPCSFPPILGRYPSGAVRFC